MLQGAIKAGPHVECLHESGFLLGKRSSALSPHHAVFCNASGLKERIGGCAPVHEGALPRVGAALRGLDRVLRVHTRVRVVALVLRPWVLGLSRLSSPFHTHSQIISISFSPLFSFLSPAPARPLPFLLPCLLSYPALRSRSHNLDIVTDTPSLKHSPSTISSTSQSSISISLRRHVSSFASKFHFRRGCSTISKASKSAAIQHISNIQWSRSPSRSLSPPSPDIHRPSGLGRRASSISDLDTLAALDKFPIPCSSQGSESLSYESPPSLNADFNAALPPSPLPIVQPNPAPSSTPLPPSSRQYYQARPARTRTLSSPAPLGSPTETSPAPPQRQQQQQHSVVPTTSTTDA